MEGTSQNIFTNIVEFLDLDSLLTLRAVKKQYRVLIDKPEFWEILSRNHSTQGNIICNSWFDFDFSSYQTKLLLPTSLPNSMEIFKECAKYLKKSYYLGLRTLDSSKSNLYSGADMSLPDVYRCYESWSSLPTEHDDTLDFILYELRDVCFIYDVYFALVSVNGRIYPPKYVRVHIGMSQDSFNYSTDLLPVETTEELQHIILLPNVILGRYVKIEFISKKYRDPNDKFIFVVDYVNFVGYPASNADKSKLFKQESSQRNYLYFDAIDFDGGYSSMFSISYHPIFNNPLNIMIFKKKGILDTFLSYYQDNHLRLNDLNIVYLLEKDENHRYLARVSRPFVYEIVGDFYYNRENYSKAIEIYSNCGNYKKLFKAKFQLGLIDDISEEYAHSNLFLPDIKEVLEIFKQIDRIKHDALLSRLKALSIINP
jgi:hypothetical protein